MRAVRAIPLLALTLLMLLPATAFAGRPSGVTVRVDDDGTVGPTGCAGDLPASTTIQGGIDVVGPDSTVIVCAGTYVGTVEIEGSALDGLTLLGVADWKAIIEPADDFEGRLMTIVESDRVTIRRLRFRIDAYASPCTPLDSVIFMDESRGTQILANRIRAVGDNPLSCGYADGIKMDAPQEGDSANMIIAWNVITDFAVNGIELCGPDRPSKIHQNSLRFFHDGQDPITRGSAIFVYCSISSGPTSITRNVVRARPTAGVSTPALNRGIDIGCCVDLVQANRISGAVIGIDINAQSVSTLIRRNTLVGGPEPAESTGAEISSDGGIRVRLRENDITDFHTGVLVKNWSDHVIADNDLRGNDIPCTEVTDDGGTPNTWTGNLGCPAPVAP